MPEGGLCRGFRLLIVKRPGHLPGELGPMYFGGEVKGEGKARFEILTEGGRYRTTERGHRKSAAENSRRSTSKSVQK